MKRNVIILNVLLPIILITCAFGFKTTHSIGQGYIPKAGFVPNVQTAVKVAEPILKAIYGEKNIDKEKPLQAKLVNSIWIIKGSLPKGKLYIGGVAEIHISKKDCRILFLSHSK